MTWPDAVKGFGDFLASEEKSEHTRRNYTEDLGLFAGWYAKHYEEAPDPGQLGPTEVREWKQYLAGDLKLKPATINRKLSAIRAFVKWTAKEGIGREIQTPKSVRAEKPAPRWLSRKEQLALLRAVDRSDRDGTPIARRNGAVIRILLHTGLRAEELTELLWDDCPATERKGQVIVRKGKGRKYREVPANSEVRAALAAIRPAQVAGDAHVFEGQRGPITAWTVHSIVTGYAEPARLPDLSPHVLRHTFCRRLAEQGARLEQIAALAGHESLDTTRRYVEPGREELAQLVDRLSGEE